MRDAEKFLLVFIVIGQVKPPPVFNTDKTHLFLALKTPLIPPLNCWYLVSGVVGIIRS